ncbi:hypothetical protein CU098_010662 [Rhizopus stolonifer]|uniref:Uncharacterized protein n=1 Tax=Rhizopus stolonifer TaxID=4846 RepID=A0A367JMW6_RHIST|nr:hypothetical protein CU098_010662 [Rhizopus stolonifer]
MSSKLHYFMEGGQGKITTEEGIEAMNYLIEEGNEFNLKNLTNLTKHRMEVLVKKDQKSKAESDSYRSYIVD